jgi:hypothetical protein
MSESIDPIEYGKLLAKVEALETKIVGMDNDIKQLLALANQSKGGFWMGMAIASFAGGIVTWVFNHLIKG